MKLIRGIVREEKVEEIVRELERADVSGFTITRAVGGGTSVRTGSYRGMPYRLLQPVCHIEVIVAEEAATEIARIILEGARTGYSGDGHVFIFSIDECCSVRTRFLDVA